VCSVLTPQVGLAYSHPLTDESVRDAYFLGQDSDRAATFLEQYQKALPVPQTGPHVSQIQLSTPYAQVVEDSQARSVGYSAQDATAAYRKRGDFIVVRVRVLFTPTYTDRAEAFWRGVSVGLVQKKHMVATRVSGQTLYATDHDGDSSWVIGADVFCVFSVAGVDSDSVQVEVIPPEGAAVHATFELDELS
jgi:hypothetical protein